LQRNLDTLSLFPRFSLLGGLPPGASAAKNSKRLTRARPARGPTVCRAYRESVMNAAVSMVAPSGMFSTSDAMPDLFSNSSIFNAGNFHSSGYSASVTQNLGQNLNASLTYGSTGALTTAGRELAGDDPDDLRSMIHMGRRHAATARMAAAIPYAARASPSATSGPATQRWAMAGNV